MQYKDIIPNHFGQTNTHIIFSISSSIVEKIIGDMFFHPDDHGSITHECALNLFMPKNDGDGYTVTIKNPLQFHLIVGYLAKGLSFRQVEEVFLRMKQLTGMVALGSLNDTTVANYARVVCAINLQRLAEILNDDKMWVFSLANDASTHYGMSYFDNRIHFHRDGILYNVHVLAIPMFEQHTGENMSNLISNFLDIVCSDWRVKLIGVSTDGASVMTGP